MPPECRPCRGGGERARGGDGNMRALMWSQQRSPRGSAMRLVPTLSALAVACLSVLAAAREPDVNLPDIGSSAASLATPQELREYGAGMLQEMRAYDLVVDDPLLVDYINALGYRLVASSDHPDPGFTFFIVRDD